MRKEEQEVDINLFEEFEDTQAYEYLKGKYSEELAKEVRIAIYSMMKTYTPISNIERG